MSTEWERRGRILEIVMEFGEKLAAEPEVQAAVHDWNPIIPEMVLVFEETLRRNIPVPGKVVEAKVET